LSDGFPALHIVIALVVVFMFLLGFFGHVLLFNVLLSKPATCSSLQLLLVL
jgi:hypothetical protein